MALTLASLSHQVAVADGPINEDETTFFRDMVRKLFSLSDVITSKALDHFRRPCDESDRDSFSACCSHCGPKFVSAALQFLIGVAAADGPLNQKEWSALRSLVRSIGLDPDTVFGEQDPTPQRRSTGSEWRTVLGVAPDANFDEVKVAYRSLVKDWHPDRHTHRSHEERLAVEIKMKKINAAYAAAMDDFGVGDDDE